MHHQNELNLNAVLPRYIAIKCLYRERRYIAIFLYTETGLETSREYKHTFRYINGNNLLLQLKSVQFEFCLRHLPMQPFMQDAMPKREQPFLRLKGKFLSKNAHVYLLAGLAMVGTYDS